MKRLLFLGVLAFLLTLGMASAQVETQGRIVVVVVDQQDSRVPGATVSASATDTITAREAISNDLGEAILMAMDPSAEYTVVIQLAGFATTQAEEVLVRSGQTSNVQITLSLAGVAEAVTVTAESPIVDVTSAIQGQDITLELTESLPTGRSYQSYLQLVPGVAPDAPDAEGNPASKSGVNARRGVVGQSTDNYYYIDGINVTDGYAGKFGANLNTEIIQEQKVITGGIPAEYVGAPGLISNVVLKSGTNNYAGSVNYFFQNSSLIRENTNSEQQKFSRFDAAGTFGGPIIPDQAWFFTSYRRLVRDDDVTSLDTQELLRSVNESQDQGYAKGTWSPTATDTFSFTFLNDPTAISGQRSRTVMNARDRSRDRGGNRFNIKYARLIGTGGLLDVGYNKHNGEESQYSGIRESANQIIYLASDDRTYDDEQRGGYGGDYQDERDTELFRAGIDYHLEAHDIKAGFEYKRNSRYRNDVYLGDTVYASWNSLAPHLAGASAMDLVSGSYSNWNFNVTNVSDFAGFMNTINGMPNRQDFYDAFDMNGDGTITPTELGQTLTFSGTEGNPHGMINYDRNEQVEDGPQEFSSNGYSFYIQDAFQYGNLVVNAGLRSELYRHYGSDQSFIYEFPWTFGPRLSGAYDLMGDGRQKISVYYGLYFDPIRNNMTNFAGQLTGKIREEQVIALGQWINYRTRGGAQSPDAFFVPTTKTPWTDDFQLGYQIDLGQNMSFEAVYTKRRTRDILEDYDLALFGLDTSGGTAYPGPVDHPDSLWLGIEYFGYTENPGSNFVIATLANGVRNYQGVEFVFRKRYSDNWQTMLSYTYQDSKGNTQSDSDAGYQGDNLELDPMAPNRYGIQPGLIRSLAKAAVTYRLDMGLEFGVSYAWNSGTILDRANPKRLPAQTSDLGLPDFEFAGITYPWIAPGSVGMEQQPSWGQLNLRIQYHAELGAGLRGQFFLDIFNALNNQGSRQNMEVVAGRGGIAYREGSIFIDPQRLFLGVRLNF